MGLLRHLARVYLTLDPRSLGLFRIGFGVVLLTDLYNRYRGIDYWYTDGGLLPASSMANSRSLFLLASTHGQAALGMAICALIFVGLTLGFKTRWFQVLTVICLANLNNRIGVLENGGNIVLGLLALWTMFLPLGRRFSLDALRSSRPRDTRPVVSLASLAVLLQLAVIYLFNFLNKSGESWIDGSAVYYALNLPRLVTAFGVWLREALPFSALQYLTWGTLVVEAAAVILILSPLWTRFTRIAAIVLLAGLHVGFDLCLDLSSFSYAMVCFLMLLPMREHWEWLDTLRRRRAREPRRETDRSELTNPATILTRITIGSREVAVLILMVACVGLLQSNETWPDRWRYRQPELLRRITRPPRLAQKWNMFAPDPHLREITIAVNAVTVDGRTVDPFNEVASRMPRIPLANESPAQSTYHHGLPARLGQGHFFGAYSRRITYRHWKMFLPPLGAWILRYHERTGDPTDRIVSFKVYKLYSFTPKPGENEARVDRSPILTHLSD